MRKVIASLAILVHGGLFAQSGCKVECNPPPPCPSPINCECYTPPFHKVRCDWGAYAEAEFLYWYGGENGLYYAVETNSVGVDSTLFGANVVAIAPGEFNYSNPSWAPGFRVALGWQLDDGWDTNASWTWYYNKHTDSLSVPVFVSSQPAAGGHGITLPWLNNALTVSSIGAISVATYDPRPISFQSASAEWDIHLNVVDWELSRKYWLSQKFVMRPYGGVRGAWAENHFVIHGQGQQTTSVDIINTTTDAFKNNNWGVGLLAGFQPSFYFTKHWNLYANLDVALLWGQFKSTLDTNYTNTATISVSIVPPTASSSVYGMQPALDLGLGLSWDYSWAAERYRFVFDVAWEHHVWFDYFSRMKATDPGTETNVPSTPRIKSTVNMSFEEVVTNLVLGGLVVKTRFDF